MPNAECRMSNANVQRSTFNFRRGGRRGDEADLGVWEWWSASRRQLRPTLNAELANDKNT
jgi:hypothetical protein